MRRVPVWVVWALGLVPLAVLGWDLAQGGLGPDPVAAIEHRLGRTAVYLLLATLSVTPILRFCRINLVRFRRALGLLTFLYAALHLAAWVVLDMGLMWSEALRDVVKRPYLTIGMAAWVILAILAASSSNRAIRVLGRRWKTLHRLVYPAAGLAILHWLMAYKLWPAWGLTMGAGLVILLALRVRWGRVARWGARKSE